ncbi:hypothetical protein NIES37_38180 [Tolypothrix tenuis PCC 7101]|uniref:DUF1822 family protein n=1 Tax=Tolypothrix tenuis PCC 7101 TaxID=231146 RepID=A0A1Z4N294_9CYAN|nr:DUF1822 family protein [Aulosira sp. FACHB-113]BAY99835.1 hypothetical protein NIES37_38180 [Tolypothrix tenuis PCC 7101]BAZ76243.1 hypothetical protein NIES50_48410 [Aulosira laxa NIES-50]
MLNLNTKLISIPIDIKAQLLASEFAAEQSTVQKGRKVYFNTLAVYAVHCYLKWLQIPTDLEESESWHPILQSSYDVADLVIPNLGKLECRPVFHEDLPGAITIPPSAREDRIGCVAVLFRDRLLNQVELLGFLPPLDSADLPEAIPIKDFRSVESLIDYLNEIESSLSLTQEFEQIRISRDWLQGRFGENWQPEQELIAGRRSNNERLIEEITRVKLINLAENIVALLVSVISETDNKFHIMFRLYPAGQAFTLPTGLKLNVFDDEDGELIEQEEAGQADNYIQIELLEAEPGFCVSVQLSLGEVSFTEYFVV